MTCSALFVVFGSDIFRISLFRRTWFFVSAKICAIFSVYSILLTSKYAELMQKLHGLFIEACPTSSIDFADASALMIVLFFASFACSTSYFALSASCCATCFPVLDRYATFDCLEILAAEC